MDRWIRLKATRSLLSTALPGTSGRLVLPSAATDRLARSPP